MPIIRDLLIKIGFISDGRGLKQVESGITSLKHSALMIGEAIAGAEFAMFELLKTTAEEAFEIKRLSGIMGIATNDFQLLAKSAEMSEVDMESFTLAMRRFGVVTGQAMRGGKEQLKDFAAIGITSFKNSNGTIKNQVQLLQEVADKLLNIKNPQERLSIVYKIFGRQGTQIINFLQRGSQGIRELANEVKDFGYIFSPEDIKQSEKFVENLKLTKLFVKGLKDEIGVKLLPSVNKYIESLKEWVRENRELIVQNIQDKIAGINKFLKGVWFVLNLIFNVISKLIDKIGGMNKVLEIAGILFGIITGAKIIRGLFAMIKPIVAITKALVSMDIAAAIIPELFITIGTALYLLYDDVKNFHEGNNSLIGDLSKKYPELAKIIVAFVDNGGKLLVETFRQISVALEGIIESFEYFGKLIVSTGKLLSAFFKIGYNNISSNLFGEIGGLIPSLNPADLSSKIFGNPAKSSSNAIKSSVTNNININVPAGTTESQQKWFKNAISEAFDQMHQDSLRGVLNAFPVVEN